jgi:hypothetical protein
MEWYLKKKAHFSLKPCFYQFIFLKNKLNLSQKLLKNLNYQNQNFIIILYIFFKIIYIFF